MPYVIACGDEGVQINEGTRVAVVGAGFRVPHFTEIIAGLKEAFAAAGVKGDEAKLRVASSDENDWTKEQLQLDDWDQVDASMQQHIEALADREKILYAGHLPFSDPQALKHGVKGHMVRPRGVHIANKVAFTLAGGEQKYNLGCYMISAEWVPFVKPAIAKEVLQLQLEFYKKIAKKDLTIVFEKNGILGEKHAEKVAKQLQKIGISE